ncbi:MAG TPA: NADP-dependent phosphogluconate dehydrogenase [Thermoanaerobaculia bacterium]|nr:NADP-dependent phosphogluconate dehydrogenase [Thermoanaerobaculia bacterium]
MTRSRFGIAGLGVMGRNLALNIEEHGVPVAVWDVERAAVERFTERNAGKQITGVKSLEELARAIERPRRIMMLVPAGEAVEQTLAGILAHLDAGDVLIDGGNSWFLDTRERSRRLEAAKIHFVGAGISGGEDGARFGASLMPGCTAEAWQAIRPVFEAIAARSDSGPCVTRVGPDGAGHFVKIVHNGIEYADMQLIAETYELLRRGAGMAADEMAAVFEEWNRGPLQSFLIEITVRILRVRDPETGQPLVDRIVDKAGQKGTGKWASSAALDLAVAVPTITAAVDARLISSCKAERKALSAVAAALLSSPVPDRGRFADDLHDALLASRICAYAQGMSLIRAGSERWSWNIDLGEIARIWKGGCIIQARLLDTIMRAYEKQRELSNLLLAEEPRKAIAERSGPWRRTVSFAQSNGLAVPGMSASLAWYDAWRTADLPQNLTQAQRDLFGAHGYQRKDGGEEAPVVHGEWK